MGRVYQQKSGRWAIRFDLRDPSGKRSQPQIGGFRTKAQAEKELKKIEVDIERGEYTRSAPITVVEFMDVWMKDHVRVKLAAATEDFYSKMIDDRFKAHFDKIKLCELKANQIERFYRDLEKNSDLSTNSIHHRHKMIRAALNKAVKWGYLKESPIKMVDSPKQESVEMKYWTTDDIWSALEVFKGTPIEWHVRVVLLTGLREGEVGAINEKYINYKNREFKIEESVQRVTGKGIVFKPPKTEKSRSSLPITEEIESLFKERQLWIKTNRMRLGDKYNNAFAGYLSVWENGDIIDPKYIGRVFHKILKEHPEIPMIRFHDLRHTCATWLISQGVDIKTIQEILRHKHYSTTADTYGHVSTESKRGAMEKLKLGV